MDGEELEAQMPGDHSLLKWLVNNKADWLKEKKQM